MRIAVIGSVISGRVSSWLLSREHEVEQAGCHHAVDSGFIVYWARPAQVRDGISERTSSNAPIVVVMSG